MSRRHSPVRQNNNHCGTHQHQYKSNEEQYDSKDVVHFDNWRSFLCNKTGRKRVGRGVLFYLSALVALSLILSFLSILYYLVHFNDHLWKPSTISHDLLRFTESVHSQDNHHTNSCVITIAAWRKYGHVQTLYDSIQIHSPAMRCFIWFVADAVHHSTTDGSFQTVESIKENIKGRFDIITVDSMSKTMRDFGFMKRATFTSDLTEDQFTAYLTPFALHYTLQQYENIDSVIFLDKHLWVNNTLDYIQMKLNTQAFTIGPSRPDPSDPFNAEHVGVMAFSKKAPVTTKYLATWMNELRRQGAAPFHVISLFEEEDWQELYDGSSEITYWNLHMPQKVDKEIFTSTETAKRPVLFIQFTQEIDEETDTTQYLSSVEKTYRRLLKKHNTSYFEQLEFGFNYFSDGTMIEPWMRVLYEEMFEPVQEHEDGTLVYSENIYTRIYFQERVYTDPFCAELSEVLSLHSSEQITFLQWLLLGLSSQAVNMDGHFYFSEVEDNVWKSLTYYPMDHAIDNPLGENTQLYKFWFEQAAEKNGLVSKQLHQKVLSHAAYHRANHALYHKSAASRKDLGVNVIGWHAGLFGIAKTALIMYQAANYVGIGVNAIELRPVSVQSFVHPRALPFNLSRSCSQQVNLVMMNADYTLFTKTQIPDLLWNHKYNIGYWEWELDIFPTEWMSNLEYYDEIWAPSKFTAESIINSEEYDGTPVKVLPLPLTIEGNNKKKRKNHIPSHKETNSTTGVLQVLLEQVKDAFVFMTIFDFNSHLQRKNPHKSIRVFLDAFPSESDKQQRYHLIIKSHHGSPSDINTMKAIAQSDPRVHFLSNILSDDEHRTLQDRADCYVSLHRSEGYGMNILEEMGHGVPVIATNYSGNVDFFPPLEKFIGSCIFPIPYRFVTIKVSSGPYKEGNRWAEADHRSAVQAMQQVVKNQCKQKYGVDISRTVISNFGMEAVGEKIKVLLHESWERIRVKEKKWILQDVKEEKRILNSYYSYYTK